MASSDTHLGYVAYGGELGYVAYRGGNSPPPSVHFRQRKWGEKPGPICSAGSKFPQKPVLSATGNEASQALVFPPFASAARLPKSFFSSQRVISSQGVSYAGLPVMVSFTSSAPRLSLWAWSCSLFLSLLCSPSLCTWSALPLLPLSSCPSLQFLSSSRAPHTVHFSVSFSSLLCIQPLEHHCSLLKQPVPCPPMSLTATLFLGLSTTLPQALASLNFPV